MKEKERGGSILIRIIKLAKETDRDREEIIIGRRGQEQGVGWGGRGTTGQVEWWTSITRAGRGSGWCQTDNQPDDRCREQQQQQGTPPQELPTNQLR